MTSFFRILPKLALAAAVVAMTGGTFTNSAEARKSRQSSSGYPQIPKSGGTKGDQCSQTCAPVLEPKIMFVSSETYDGNLGGLDGADAKCQALAEAVISQKYPNGLPGTYKAWLSDTSGLRTTEYDPASRFIPKSAGPYMRPDGALVATSYSDLTDGYIASRILVAEDGTLLPGNPQAWTATRPYGFSEDAGCGVWDSVSGSGTTGFAYDVTSTWSFAQLVSCSTPEHLYCVQQ